MFSECSDKKGKEKGGQKLGLERILPLPAERFLNDHDRSGSIDHLGVTGEDHGSLIHRVQGLLYSRHSPGHVWGNQ